MWKEKKVTDMIKDNLGGRSMTEFVALRAKMYRYRNLKKKLEDNCWKGTWRQNNIQRARLFENKKHVAYTVNKHKITLNKDDGNRLVQAGGIRTLARGY